MLTTQAFDFDARIGLFQDRDNLGFTESSPFHENLLGYPARKLYVLSVRHLRKLTRYEEDYD